MPKFIVQFTETRDLSVNIEAATAEEAEKKAHTVWDGGDDALEVHGVIIDDVRDFRDAHAEEDKDSTATA